MYKLECNLNVKNDEILKKNLDESVPNYKCFSATSNENSKIKCHFCSESLKLERMRQHIGKHIINKELPINQHTCGLCGLVGCSITLVSSLCKGSHIMKPTSYDCKYFVNFNIKSAQKSNQYSPCTNCPVKCDVCDGIYWSYNMECHFNENHNVFLLSDKYLVSEKEQIDVKNLVI